MSELVLDGINGYTFEVGSSKSLKQVIEKIIIDPSILNSLNSCRDSVVSIQNDVKEIIEVYKNLI